jgi:hypothetical protein
MRPPAPRDRLKNRAAPDGTALLSACEGRKGLNAPRIENKESVDIVSFLETIDSSARVDQLLLAGEERMALRTNINAKVFFGGASFNHVAAGTPDRRLRVFRMNTFLHDYHLFQLLT